MLNNFPLWPDSASTMASRVDALYIFLLLVTGMMALLVFACVVFFAARYRHRPGVRAQQVEGSNALEIAWSVIPFLVFMVIFGWGQREINELHVPVGRDVKLIMTSQDVIHSFYIPAFRIKQDVLPGRYTVEWFHATKPGVYHLFCAEYCGTQHSGMVGSIVVEQPADYEAWMKGGANGNSPLSASGEKMFSELGCSSCHRSDVEGRGPNLHGVFGHPVELADGRTVKVDENYIRESILDPGSKRLKGFQPIMPTFQGLVSEEQVNELVAYIKSISPSSNANGINPEDGKTDGPKIAASTAASAHAAAPGSKVQ
jgi:cytochrome c oxidase subunit 2